MSDTNIESGEKRNRKVSLPLLFLFLLSLGLNAYLFYDWYNNNYTEDGRSYKEVNAELEKVLEGTKFSRDSLQKEYDLLSEQYESIFSELEALRLEHDQTLEELGQKKVRIRQLITQGTEPRKLIEARGQIEELKKELNDYRIKHDLAVEEAEKYRAEMEAKKAYADDLERQKSEISDKNAELKEKMDNATLRISDLIVRPLRERRKGMEETTRSSKVDEIEISFTVLESPMIEPGEKEMVLRLIGTGSEVLGANNDLLTDSDKLVSMKKEFTYDGKNQKFKFNFKQDEEYKAGKHTAEIWCDGKMITRSPFNLE